MESTYHFRIEYNITTLRCFIIIYCPPSKFQINKKFLPRNVMSQLIVVGTPCNPNSFTIIQRFQFNFARKIFLDSFKKFHFIQRIFQVGNQFWTHNFYYYGSRFWSIELIWIVIGLIHRNTRLKTWASIWKWSSGILVGGPQWGGDKPTLFSLTHWWISLPLNKSQPNSSFTCDAILWFVPLNFESSIGCFG